MESSGKENLTVAVPGKKRIAATTGPEGNEAQQASEEARVEVAVAPGPEETTAERKSEGGERPKEGGRIGAGGLCDRSTQGTHQWGRGGANNETWWQDSARDPRASQPTVPQIEI